jgi:hypothetical protein
MTVLLRRDRPVGWPRVAVLTPAWGSGEAGWAVRQLAGVLARSADVHVLTPEGDVRRGGFDGPFTVHRTATAADRRVLARRDVMVRALGEAGVAPGHRALADAARAGETQWAPMVAILRALHPDLVVVADHRELGAVAAVDAAWPDVPVVLLPLARRGQVPASALFEPVFSRAGVALAFSADEAAMVRVAAGSPAVAEVGLPLAANPSVQREPNTFTRDVPYALVCTGAPWGRGHWPGEVTTLLHGAFPDHAVVVSATDRLVCFAEGEERHTAAAERGSDLLRLMAWARVVVDVRPGSLVARRTLDALLYGVPVVAPADSRARAQVEAAAGGLWFEGAGDLVWCVEALLDERRARVLGRQGWAWAEAHYGGRERFCAAVEAAVAGVLRGAAAQAAAG